MRKRKRKRKRTKARPAVVLCPIHKCLMRVRCVIEQQQYRYCPVDGCRKTAKTKRTKPPRPRAATAQPAVASNTNPNRQRGSAVEWLMDRFSRCEMARCDDVSRRKK